MLSSHQEIILESINNYLKDILKELRSYKHPADSTDGGCQMPKTAIAGYCCVCGSPNRTCQPEKQPTQKSDYGQMQPFPEQKAVSDAFKQSTKP